MQARLTVQGEFQNKAQVQRFAEIFSFMSFGCAFIICLLFLAPGIQEISINTLAELKLRNRDFREHTKQ